MLLSLKCNKREAIREGSLAIATMIKMLDQTQHNLEVEDPQATEIKGTFIFKLVIIYNLSNIYSIS